MQLTPGDPAMTIKTKAPSEALLLEIATKHFISRRWRPATGVLARASTFTMCRSGRSVLH
jgi:hypothetical protein